MVGAYCGGVEREALPDWACRVGRGQSSKLGKLDSVADSLQIPKFEFLQHGDLNPSNLHHTKDQIALCPTCRLSSQNNNHASIVVLVMQRSHSQDMGRGPWQNKSMGMGRMERYYMKSTVADTASGI